MKVFKISQIRDIDQYTISNEPISSLNLMERAAQAFSKLFMSRIPVYRKVVVFAGPGNNGGDALAVARILLHNGYDVETFLFNPKGRLSNDCDENKDKLWRTDGVKFTEVKDAFSPPELGSDIVVIDGLFGSGLTQPLSGGFAGVVQYINKSDALVISIDVPTGLFGENNEDDDENIIIQADWTYTFQSPKLAFFLPENEKYVGKWEVLDIGLHPDAIEEMETTFHYVVQDEVTGMIRPRSKFAHKGNFGHALLVAGSYGKMGAAILAAKACLRTGAGLLTAHIPESGNWVMQSCVPEAMITMDKNPQHITNVPEPRAYTAIAVGPGIGLAGKTCGALQELLDASVQPLVLDADALNIISENKDLLAQLPANSILTPHPKEFDRLAGTSGSSFERLEKAVELAAEINCYIILKGAYTAVCTPEKQCYFNTTGNPGMATAGSGDVLTGMILGLLSQGYQPAVAAVLGVYLHGLAGDLAVERTSPESLIAGDIVEYIGLAFREISL